MRTYELMTIYRPDMAEADVRTAVDKVQEDLTGRGATVTSSDFWGKRRFAYEIDHMNEGYYAVVQFEAEADAVDTVSRALKLSDDVVRHKIVRPE